MKLKTVIIAAAIIGIAAPVSAQSLEVKPDTFQESIVAGETIQKNITLEWTGEVDTVARIDAIFNDSSGEDASEGFTATFDKNPVVVDDEGQTVVLAEIETHPALKKDNYTIQIQAESEIEQKTVRRGGGDGGTRIIYENVTQENETLQERLQELKDTRDGLSNQIEDLRSDQDSINEELENIIEQRDELNRSVQVLESRQEELRQEKEQNAVLGAVAGSILSIFALALVIGFVKRDDLVSRVRAWRKNDLVSNLSGAEDVEN